MDNVAGPSHAGIPLPRPPSAGNKRGRLGDEAVAAGTSTSSYQIVPSLRRALADKGRAEADKVKPLARAAYKAEKKLNSLKALQAAGGVPKTIIQHLQSLPLRVGDKQAYNQHIPSWNAILANTGAALFQELVDAYTTVCNNAQVAFTTAASLVPIAVDRLFQELTKDSDARSTSRLTATLDYVLLDIDQHMSATWASMKQSIVGKVRPPAPLQQQPAGRPAVAAAGDGGADMEAEIGPLNQEALQQQQQQPQEALISKADLDALLKEFEQKMLKQQAAALRHKPTKPKPQQQQQEGKGSKKQQKRGGGTKQQQQQRGRTPSRSSSRGRSRTRSALTPVGRAKGNKGHHPTPPPPPPPPYTVAYPFHQAPVPNPWSHPFWMGHPGQPPYPGQHVRFAGPGGLAI